MYPISGGNATPQMFAMPLINPMETAAAVPDRYSVVTAQNTGVAAQLSAIVTTSRVYESVWFPE